MPLAGGSEFDLVRELLAVWGDAASGIGDDAAVLDIPAGHRLVVSTDTSVEDVHFRREWLNHFEIGYRATASAWSDIAAMAAAPLGCLVSITLPERDVPAIRNLARGILDAADYVGSSATAGSAGVLLGGDLTRGEKLSLTITVLGAAKHVLSRSAARVGDHVFVTGALGGPAAAVRAWTAGKKPDAKHRARFSHPEPRIHQSLWLARNGAHSAIDISDGLTGDLAHIAAASGVRVEINLDQIPCVEGVSALEAATSGEEYELAVTASELDTEEFFREFALDLTAIGTVVGGDPGVDVLDNGQHIATKPGFDHFRSR